jgi:hypothetical protein
MARTADSDKDAALAELRLYAQTEVQPALEPAEIDAILDGVQRATFWAASKAYNVNDVILPVTLNGRRFKCVRAGTSGTTEPTWPRWLGGIFGEGSGDLLWREDGPEYTNVFDVRGAICAAWMTKAAKASALFNIKSRAEGFDHEQVYNHCLDMAERYAPVGIS